MLRDCEIENQDKLAKPEDFSGNKPTTTLQALRNRIMRVAITGASGLVGTELVRRLNKQGLELYSLRRPTSKTASNSSSKSANEEACISWNPATGVDNPEQLEGLDAIVHLAGRSIGAARWSSREKTLLRDSRVQATERLVDQIAKLKVKPKLFLSASAIGIYGDTGDKWVDETSNPTSDFLGSLATDWERASQPLSEMGVRVVHARFGVILAKHGGALAKMLPLFRWGLGGVLGDGKQFMSWISLNDCCRAIQHLLVNASLSGAFNIVSPNPVTNREFTKTLGNDLHRMTILPVPKFVLRLGLGEMADALLLTSCRVQPKRLNESGFTFEQPTLDQALQVA